MSDSAGSQDIIAADREKPLPEIPALDEGPLKDLYYAQEARAAAADREAPDEPKETTT